MRSPLKIQLKRLLENRNGHPNNLKNLTFPSRKICIESRFQMAYTVFEKQSHIYSQEKILCKSFIMRKNKKLWENTSFSFANKCLIHCLKTATLSLNLYHYDN